ncbi:MAG: VIT1/CCC1 transporter family protein [Verrucomicrobiota bacterium]|jgi:VIT1/CCC1 family predicted Fe2+/Mn2+ transporter|nr:hypothetical protein [Verrucomicrobiota bacterium]
MGISKRVEEARRAFLNGDHERSAKAHKPSAIAKAASEEHGGAGSQYIGDFVYGGLDGIITTFAVVCGVAGADLETRIILIMGLANLLADGFSMATGAFLSARSEQEYYRKEREREAWEIDHFPEGERIELLEIYQNKGYAKEEAEQLTELITRNKERWLDAMMVDELGMLPDESSPLLNGVATLVAFVLAGSVPLLVYFLGLVFPIAADLSFAIALGLSGVALFGLGVAKVLVTHLNPWKSGLEMLLVGGLAAFVAYLVGGMLKGLGAA